MDTAAWIALALTCSFLLAVVVGKAIKHGQRDGDTFRRDLHDPNRDHNRDDLGGHR